MAGKLRPLVHRGLLGGGDDTGLDEWQWQQRVAGLRQKAAQYGIETILVAVDNRSTAPARTARREVASLAGALDATLVSWEWGNQYGNLDFVADLLSGEHAVFTAEIHLTGAPDTFRSGAMLLLPVILYNRAWGVGGWEGNLQVAVRIP